MNQPHRAPALDAIKAARAALTEAERHLARLRGLLECPCLDGDHAGDLEQAGVCDCCGESIPES